MERKIGEIFEYNGEWYQCIKDAEHISCINCCFYNGGHKLCTDKDMGDCAKVYRSDAESICFKKLEKVGKPIIYMSRTFQRLKSSDAEQCKYCYFGNQVCNPQLCGKESFLVEIKQNKEDMGQEIEYSGNESDNAKHSNSENIGKNLKPFDLEAAKSGKPVCTRNGRKARIICFDAKGDKPIIALIEYEIDERPCNYFANGRFYSNPNENNDADLMMLPEKKEGWVNVYKEPEGEYYVDKLIHKTKKFAFDVACPDNYIGTVKIEWYE